MVWLKGARVQLWKEEELIAEGYTDQKGYFSAVVPAGRYRILITYNEKLRLEWEQDIPIETKFAVKLQKYWKAMTLPVQVIPALRVQHAAFKPVSIEPIVRIVTVRYPCLKIEPIVSIQTLMKVPVSIEPTVAIQTFIKAPVSVEPKTRIETVITPP